MLQAEDNQVPDSLRPHEKTQPETPRAPPQSPFFDPRNRAERQTHDSQKSTITVFNVTIVTSKTAIAQTTGRTSWTSSGADSAETATA
jgi:hypothetical protein